MTDTLPLSGTLDRLAQLARRHIATSRPVSLDELAGLYVTLSQAQKQAFALEDQIAVQAVVCEGLANEREEWEATARRVEALVNKEQARANEMEARARELKAQFDAIEAMARDVDPTHIGLFDHAWSGAMRPNPTPVDLGGFNCAGDYVYRPGKSGEVVHPHDSGQALDLREAFQREQRAIQAQVEEGERRIERLRQREAEIAANRGAAKVSQADCGNDKVIFAHFGAKPRAITSCGGPQDGDAA